MQNKIKYNPYVNLDFEKSRMQMTVDTFGEIVEKRKNVTDISQQVAYNLLHEGHYMNVICAPPQFGKTAIIKDIIRRLVVEGTFHIKNIFNITGLSDCEWLNQMKERMFPSITEHIYHNANIKQNLDEIIQTILRGGSSLFVIDEAHYASGNQNTWAKSLWKIVERLNELKPEEKREKLENTSRDETDVSANHIHRMLYRFNIRIICISATPDSIKENIVNFPEDLKTSIITVKASNYPGYVGFETYLNKSRVSQTLRFDAEMDEGVCTSGGSKQTFADELVCTITKMTSPKYHLMRLNLSDMKGLPKFEKLLQDQGIDYCFQYMNYKSHDFQTENLWVEPKVHTFVFLKDMLRVAKSITTKHIGILLERPVKTTNDSTVSQSLIGRCCGWDKAEHIENVMIYTHVASIIKYIKLNENDFNYDQVVGIRGYGIRTTRRTLRTRDTFTGQGHDRSMIVNNQGVSEDIIVELKMKLKRNIEKRLHVFDMMKKLIQNNNEPMHWDNLKETGNLATTCYTKWSKNGSHYQVLEKVPGKKKHFRIRDDILQEYGDLVKSLIE